LVHFFLIRWVIESPNYDFEELVELVIKVSEHVKHLECLC